MVKFCAAQLTILVCSDIIGDGIGAFSYCDCCHSPYVGVEWMEQSNVYEFTGCGVDCDVSSLPLCEVDPVLSDNSMSL